MPNDTFLATTAFELPGYKVEKNCGIVRGLVVRSPTIAQGFLGGLKNIIGGRIESYREMCEAARNEAYQEMVQHAQSLGANAVVGMRYDSSDLGSSASRATEILCYGTAVVISK